MPSSIRVLALFAHPDDAEFLCAGTLAHLADRGASLHISSLTAGDCGSSILPSAKISRIRRREAQRGAALLHAQYTCLGERDLLVSYDRPTLRKVMDLVRRVDPALVFTHSPQDYMADHETASRLCQTACFGASAPNFRTGARHPAPAVRTIPHLYYAQPFSDRDILGDAILPRLVVDISATLERKERMLACHESQRAWLQFQQGLRHIDDPLRQMAARAGELGGSSGERVSASTWARHFLRKTCSLLYSVSWCGQPTKAKITPPARERARHGWKSSGVLHEGSSLIQRTGNAQLLNGFQTRGTFSESLITFLCRCGVPGGSIIPEEVCKNFDAGLTGKLRGASLQAKL